MTKMNIQSVSDLFLVFRLMNDLFFLQVSSACMWIRYLELSSLLGLLDVLEERAQIMPTLPTLELIKTVLEAFQSRTLFESESESESTLKERLPQLLSLRSILPDFLLLEDLIAVAIEASLPIGLDGSPLFSTAASTSEVDFRTIINRSNARWSHRTHSLAGELDIRQFLNQDRFSDSTVRIISALVYCRCFSIEDIVEWLGAESCSRRQIDHLLPIFHAVLDSFSLSQMTLLIKKSITWLPYISPIVRALADQNSSVVLRTLGRSCIINILSNAGEDLPAIMGVLTEEVDVLTEKTVSVELMSLGVALTSKLSKDANFVTSILVDRGMQCMIDQYQLIGDHNTRDHETMVHKKLADELGM
jgi:nucleolar pre-ribosomal-associated protein 1